MSECKSLLSNSFEKGIFVEAIFSSLREKNANSYNKITARPVQIKEAYRIQLTYAYDKKIIHENLTVEDASSLLSGLMERYFKQAVIHTHSTDYHLLSNKRFELTISKKKGTKVIQNLDHNTTKNYVLQEGTPHDFLVALDIMNIEGKVFKPKFAKFRQINKYLEILEDTIKTVSFDEIVRIIDFGCGKAYLTFAMYYYFVQILKKPVEIVGLDLKADVIANLTKLKEKLGYENLRFQQGDIQDFVWDKSPEIVVSLHACDTATDETISKAIAWNTKVIMAVPCCQHEAYTQIEQKEQNLFLKQGVLKERFSALATDAIRATLLEILGYNTVVMEFIDMEHTPKNLMIRAVSTGSCRPEKIAEFRNYCKYWHLEPHLGSLLKQKLIQLENEL